MQEIENNHYKNWYVDFSKKQLIKELFENIYSLNCSIDRKTIYKGLTKRDNINKIRNVEIEFLTKVVNYLEYKIFN